MSEQATWLEVANRIPPSRTIVVEGRLILNNLEKYRRRLKRLQESDGDGDIGFIVNSKGGHTAAGLELFYLFSKSPVRIVGIVKGEAKSAGFMALQGCHVRLATSKSILQIHDPERFDTAPPLVHHEMTLDEYLDIHRGRFPNIKAEVEREREEVVTILAKVSKLKDIVFLEEFLKREKVMNAEEALSLGFLDGVIEGPALI
ncbi:MAG TPA: ATP-dependent Clp protease proteolytic subunit [Candidatus Paceibacterota bacterium]